MLIPLTLLLIGPYVVLTAAGLLFRKRMFSQPFKGRLGVTLFLLATASGHFFKAEAMQHMLPPAVPLRLEVVYATGVIEILGAAGIWLAPLKRLTGALIILMLLCFLPANVYAALNDVEFGGSANGPRYLVLRVPYQFFVMWWIYRTTEQCWFARPASGRAITAARGPE